MDYNEITKQIKYLIALEGTDKSSGEPLFKIETEKDTYIEDRGLGRILPKGSTFIMRGCEGDEIDDAESYIARYGLLSACGISEAEFQGMLENER